MPNQVPNGSVSNTDRKLVRNSTVEFLLFTSRDDEGSIEARYSDETIWLTQKLMSSLFGVDVRTVNEHLKNVYETGELSEQATIREFRIVRQEGSREVSRNVLHYNLDAIISVGYRVNSVRATQFRQWATGVLHDFALQGYVLDQARLENGSYLGKDYFEKLLEEIREIRLSERRFHQKVTDIFATSLDYDPAAPSARSFFSTVQNKLHFAVHGNTAAEIIQQRADASNPRMGLTSWDNAPNGKILSRDTVVAKNYLNADEIDQLARLVSAFLELAEGRARRHIPMTMDDWAKNLDSFLLLDDRKLLSDEGSVSHTQATHHAQAEFEKFRIVQDQELISDFDRFVQTAEQHQRSSRPDLKEL